MKPANHPARVRRPLFWLLGLAALAVAAWAFWPRALAVETARVARGPLETGFTEEARTRLADRWLVSAPVDGIVDRVMLEPGDAVAAGQTVAVLRPSRAALLDPASREAAAERAGIAEHARAAADAALAAAQAERVRSAAELRRAEALAADRLIARADLDRSRAAAAVAAANLRSAREQQAAAAVALRAARATLALQGTAGDAGLPLPAPVAGRVVRRLVESATPVRAGTPLLEIGDPAALEVVAEVLTADAVGIAPGSEVRLAGWGGAQALRGRVRTIEPGGYTKVSALGVEEQRVNVVVALEDPPAARARLGDGYRMEARFIAWRTDDALVVPAAALFRDGTEWAVYVVEDGRARLRHVRLGHMGEDAAEATGGLREGERVVLYPGDAVRDGGRVAATAE